MKAIIIDEKIKLFGDVPKTWKNILNFRKASVDVQQSQGFYDVVIPDYDPDIGQLGPIYFDDINSVFTYPVQSIQLDIEELRAQKLAEFAGIIEQQMTPALMFAVIEKLAMGEPIPQETKDAITALRTREQQVIDLINSITDPVYMKKFPFNEQEIKDSKDLLKSGRKL